jgi:hypothetical protein
MSERKQALWRWILYANGFSILANFAVMKSNGMIYTMQIFAILGNIFAMLCCVAFGGKDNENEK